MSEETTVSSTNTNKFPDAAKKALDDIKKMSTVTQILIGKLYLFR